MSPLPTDAALIPYLRVYLPARTLDKLLTQMDKTDDTRLA